MGKTKESYKSPKPIDTSADSSNKKSPCKCKGCTARNCGKCSYCLDMRQFGGDGKRKKRCQLRVCENTCNKRRSKQDVESSLPLKDEKSSATHSNSPKKSTSHSSVKSEAAAAGAKELGPQLKKTALNPRSPVKMDRLLADSKDSKKLSNNPTSRKMSPSKTGSALSGTKVSNKLTEIYVSVPRTTPRTTKMSPDSASVPGSASQSPAKNDKKLSVLEGSAGSPLKKMAAETILTVETCKQQKVQDTTAVQKVDEPTKSVSTVANPGSESLLSEKATSVSSKTDVDLPKLKLDSMTKTELKELIPKLLKLVTGKDEVFYSRRSAKPEWWPDDVTWVDSRSAWHNEKYWTDSLKLVVKNCYRHVGKEALLYGFMEADANMQETTDGEGYITSGYPPSPVKMRMFPQDLFLPFSAEIYICYFCEKEFLSKEKMRNHQKDCSEQPPELQKIYSNVPKEEHELPLKPPQMSPKKSVNYCNWSTLALEKFARHVDLVPKLTAAKLRRQRPSVEEVKCDPLDDSEPISPITPKTPRSLMSQLSRENSNHATRKRLSYSMSMDKSHNSMSVTTDEDSDSEMEAENKHVHEMNLLDIPLSSLLGRRVKKYVRVDSPVTTVENSEAFCRTPVKNSFLEKLRKKEVAYPLLYRPRRIANLHKQNHIYRFSKQEKKEFFCRINTGLNLASFKRLRSMKKFSVRVQRLSRKKLLNWIPRRTLDRQLKGAFKGLKCTPYVESDDTACEFPSGPTLLAKNIDRMLGLKKRSAQESSKMALSLSNFISEEMEAELSKQKLTLYRSLLYEMSVLKPAVVMEDIGSQMFLKTTDASPMHKGDGKDLKTRDITSKRPTAVAGEIDEKGGYQVLRSLLRPSSSDINAGRVSKAAAVSGPITVAVDTDSGKIGKKSPGDDSVSILSISSEGDSFHSNCCQGCSNRTHVHISPSDRKVTATGSLSCSKGLETPQMEPLQVDVDLECPANMDEFGIPSPVSESGESPCPMNPENSGIQVSERCARLRNLRHRKTVDESKVKETDQKEQKSQSPSVLASMLLARNVQQEMPRLRSSSSDLDSANTKISPVALDLHLNKSDDSGIIAGIRHSPRFRIKGFITPNHSPLKKTVRMGGSLPNSPAVKTSYEKTEDAQSVCKKLKMREEMPGTDVKARLRSQSFSGKRSDKEKLVEEEKHKAVEVKTRLRSFSEKKSDMGERNAGTLKKSLSEKIEQKSSSGKAIGSDKQTGAGDGDSVGETLRRSKRKLSSPADHDPPLKLQKVSSEPSFHQRS